SAPAHIQTGAESGASGPVRMQTGGCASADRRPAICRQAAVYMRIGAGQANHQFGGLLAVEPDRSCCRSPNGMSPQPETGEFAALNADTVQAWEALAPWWDDTTGEADEFHRRLVIPATDRLLALRPGERVLDVACGNGGYARHLAAQGAEVV